MKLSVKEAVNSFFQAWKDRDYQKMFDVCQKTWAYTKTVEDLKEHFDSDDWRIKEFNVTGFSNVSNVKRSYLIEITFTDGRIERHSAIVMCESSAYNSAAYGDWGVNPVSVLKNFGTIKAKPQPKKVKSESKK